MEIDNITISKPECLQCCCCGNATLGRQWHNRDEGYGFCESCLESYQHSESEESLKECYGIRGVHYDISYANRAESMTVQERLFSGLYPTGVVFADRAVIKNNDFKKLAYLDYATLTLKIKPGCSHELRERIKKLAKQLQDKKGEYYDISFTGNPVLLGSAIV